MAKGASGLAYLCDFFLSLCTRFQSHWPSSYPPRTELGPASGPCFFCGMLPPQQLIWWLLLSTYHLSPTSLPPTGTPTILGKAPPTWAPCWSSFPGYCLVNFLYSTCCYRYYITYLFGYKLVSHFYLFHTYNSNINTDDRGFADLLDTVFLAHGTVTGSS